MTTGLNAHGGVLRPIERRVRELSTAGVPTVEIARRFRRLPETIERVQLMSELRRGDGSASRDGDGLRPIERRVLRWRAEGVDHGDIAAKFQRTDRFIRQVERLAHHRLDSA